MILNNIGGTDYNLGSADLTIPQAKIMQTYTFNGHLIKIQNSDDGQVWFCGADVARAIGYKNPAEAISSKVSGKYRTSLDLGKRGSKPIFISKPGLYELVMRSNLPDF